MPDRLYLASSSPRRRELIALLGVETEILEPPGFDEVAFTSNYSGKIENLPLLLAEAKAKLVLPGLKEGFLICADTDVVCEGEILGKPIDTEHARYMLRKMSGRWHDVITGISIGIAGEGKVVTKGETTRVKFSELSDYEINKYIATGEPMDKAGGYGIQGYAAPYIERIEGCYFNVVGLPVSLLYRMLKEHGFRFGVID